MKRQRRSFDPEFKLEAAKLVTEQGYTTVPQAAKSLDVGKTALRSWVKQLINEHIEKLGHPTNLLVVDDHDFV